MSSSSAGLGSFHLFLVICWVPSYLESKSYCIKHLTVTSPPPQKSLTFLSNLTEIDKGIHHRMTARNRDNANTQTSHSLSHSMQNPALKVRTFPTVFMLALRFAKTMTKSGLPRPWQSPTQNRKHLHVKDYDVLHDQEIYSPKEDIFVFKVLTYNMLLYQKVSSIKWYLLMYQIYSKSKL